MGTSEYGKCDMCGKERNLNRKYYYEIKCKCHSPQHCEIVSYCNHCVPKPPKTTTVTIEPYSSN